MATEKVGVYRKYRGPVPKDAAGKPLPREKWADGRPFSWAARWFGLDGRRYSKSFQTRREACLILVLEQICGLRLSPSAVVVARV
jgi:hypothetical protein